MVSYRLTIEYCSINCTVLDIYPYIVNFIGGNMSKMSNEQEEAQKSSEVLHPIVVQPKVWCQVGMDLIGPMPETPRGNKYIITLTDYLSKWAEAAPLPDKTAAGVAKFIYSVSHL